MKKRAQRVLLVFVLSVSFMFGGCAKDELLSEPEPDEFFRLVSNGAVEDMSLTIYYMQPRILTFIPVDIDSIIASCSDDKFTMYGGGGIVVIEGKDLARHTDLLYVLSNEELKPLERSYYLNARIYYIFKDKSKRTIFEVAMWGYAGDGSASVAILVNGLYVEDIDIYYDIVIPFLPENIASVLEEWKPSKDKEPL